MDAMPSAFDPARFLPDDLLVRLRERAPVHDRDNTFPHDDLDDLHAAGYLGILAPTELGGAGLSLAEAAVLQQRLAGAAPATALAPREMAFVINELPVMLSAQIHGAAA